MSDIILHHYPTSPFSEKIRAIFGYKKMKWRSVHIPTVMPKPDLMPLTGGYRKTPVMQIGADIYCDTKLIAAVLDRLQPEPTLVHTGQEFSCAAIDQWSEQVLFMLVVPLIMRPEAMPHFFSKLPPAALAAFQQDRQSLFAGGSGRRASMGATRSELPSCLAMLDHQLSSSPFLLGNTPTLADFSVYHTIWFVLSNPGIANSFDAHKNVLAWCKRMAAFGHGSPEKMSADEALDIAKNSEPQDSGVGDMPDAGGLKPGDMVVVGATDYGTDPVTGVLVKSSLNEIAIRRHNERVGNVLVHFPRAGFKIVAAK